MSDNIPQKKQFNFRDGDEIEHLAVFFNAILFTVENNNAFGNIMIPDGLGVRINNLQNICDTGDEFDNNLRGIVRDLNAVLAQTNIQPKNFENTFNCVVGAEYGYQFKNWFK